MCGAEAGHQCGGGAAPVLGLQRPPRVSRADHLTAVDVQIAELAYRPRRNITRLPGKVSAELLLHRKVPGLDIPPVEVLRRSNHCERARNVENAVAKIGDLNRR